MATHNAATKGPLGLWIGGAVAVAAIGAIFWFGYAAIREQPDAPMLMADPQDAAQVANGAALYAAHCASCHGAELEGQPGWQQPPASGPRPAPPHDGTGHTWHHGDAALFDLVKHGPGLGDAAYDGGMPAFGDRLGHDEIWAVLAFIKSRWPEPLRARQRAVTLGEQAVDHPH